MAEVAQKTTAKPSPEAKVFDPYNDPVNYLISKGWECQEGQDPRNPKSLWYDPTKPRKDEWSETLAYERDLPDGGKKQVMQPCVTPAGWPQIRDAAVSIQMNRDRNALMQAEAAKK
jgi:hypothetical protein